MAATWRFALLFSVLLMASRGLASEVAQDHSVDTSTSELAAGNETQSEHNTTGDSGHADGHGGGPITTLPIVTWKWHHVSTPYLVALWILVSWLCKLGEFHQVLSLED
ncbi:sodium/hydrogen exchanger 3 isoform X1 [Lates japonicus]|uniref:Sodium/hydrogen exchanger 3 isoform X1 n=1 Tax=Lates japonicus TaxID=270547 RepID=A0AAD3MSG0_LATJO|nr:sodium/hydrogen exchanger 3 isoform X1 [Lates japonicus]